MKDSSPNVVKFKLPSKETIFSLSTAMNLYKAYSLGGGTHAGVLAIASLSDKVLASSNVTDRNYVSLSSFWTYVGYSAIKQIQSSEKIAVPYKISLYTASILISTAMIPLGVDIFASKNDNNKTLGSVKLIAGFFDKTNEITKLEDQFEKGYVAGFIHAATNIKQILSNKFVLFSLMREGINITKLVLVQKFFQYMPEGKMAAFFAPKETNLSSYIIKLSLLKLIKNTIETIHSKITTKLTNIIKKDIEKQTIELVLKNDNTQKVMDLGEKVNKLSSSISSINNESASEITQGLNGILMPLLIPSTKSTKSTSTPAIDLNPSLFLLDSLIKTIFSNTNIWYLKEYLEKKLYGTENEDDGTEKVQTKFGAFYISTTVNPTNYAYDNIQEIAKLDGNRFMLKKAQTYIEKNSTNREENKSIMNSWLSFFKNSIEDILYSGVIISQGITQEEFYSISTAITNLTSALGLVNEEIIDTQTASPAEIRSTLKTLIEEHNGGADRLQHNKMFLQLENYVLSKKFTNENMLRIPDLKFEQGNIYAITGKIGTGKTTLLTDIAKCLMPAFSSSGKIFYPTYEGAFIPQIFCGTTPFSPPATTLFERLTYRLNQEYVASSKEDLINDAIQLFNDFNQTGFDREKLLTKGNDAKLSLSTGQGKLVMIISAILYKQSLDTPVLFVIDETLANLDITTTNLVCEKIKVIFNDSIIISVDHNAEHNGKFYSDIIKLGDYTEAAKADNLDDVDEAAAGALAAVADEEAPIIGDHGAADLHLV